MVTKPKTKKVEDVKENVEEVIGTPGTTDVLLKPGGYLASKSELLQTEQVIDIKHVFRVVSSTGEFRQDEGENVHPANVIEDYLNQTYFSQGYTLYSVEHLKTALTKGGDPLGEHMLYILVKYAQ